VAATIHVEPYNDADRHDITAHHTRQ
jgi:hypothetical protein